MLGIWTDQATQLLIASYAQLKEEFGGSTRKKKDCWLHVSEAMNVYGYNVSSSECHRKWRSRGVATAGGTGDASPVRPTMSPLHQNDNRQFVFRADF